MMDNGSSMNNAILHVLLPKICVETPSNLALICSKSFSTYSTDKEPVQVCQKKMFNM